MCKRQTGKLFGLETLVELSWEDPGVAGMENTAKKV